MKTRLITFGFEIEGEFLPIIQHYVGGLFTITRDGSLRKNNNTPKSHALLELQSKIIKNNNKGKAEAAAIMSYIEKWAEYRPNASAGFHIHLGFNPKVPPEIKSVEFSKYFLSELKKNHTESYKKRENVRYCIPNSEDDNEVNDNDRYKAVNYCSFSKHGTLEIRIYPSDTPQKMYGYLIFTLETTKRYLQSRIETNYKITFADNENEHTTHEYAKNQKVAPIYSYVSLKKCAR